MTSRPQQSWGQLIRVMIVSAALVLMGGVVSADTIHRVRSGESLWILANQYDTTIQAIRDANQITGSLIITGQQLTIPVDESSRVHTVQRGDTLWLIAQRYTVTLDQLRRANDIWHNEIRPGQQIIIPGGTSQISSSQTRTSSSVRIHLTSEERSLLARMVSAEAQGQPFAGKVAVVAVILNRIDDQESFPHYTTVENTIFGPGQFEPISNSWFWRTTVLPESYEAVDAAVGGWDPTNGALFFFNPAKSNNAFMWSRPHAITIGDHRFMY